MSRFLRFAFALLLIAIPLAFFVERVTASTRPIAFAPTGTGLMKVNSGTQAATASPADLQAPGVDFTNTLLPDAGGTGLTSPGTNGNVLTSNGSVWVSQAPAATTPTLVATDANTLLHYTLDETSTPWANTGTAGALNMTNTYGAVTSWSPALFTNGLNFTSNSGLTTGATSLGETTSSITMSLWMYVYSYTAGATILEKRYYVDGANVAPYTSAAFDQNSGGGLISFNITVGGVRNFCTTSATAWVPPLQRWFQLVGTYDGATMTIYANGYVIKTCALAGSIDYGTHGMWNLGAATNQSSGSNEIIIDDVRVESTARSQSYVRSMFQSGFPLYTSMGL